MTHFVAYLDEFGHVGQYVSRTHSHFKTSPVFGLGGILLPAEEVREFAIFFYQLKCQLLAWDITHENPRNLPAYQWEKKGSKLFTTRNVTQYRSLRQATFRLLNHIRKIGGYVIYAGEHKSGPAKQHDATDTFTHRPPRPSYSFWTSSAPVMNGVNEMWKPAPWRCSKMPLRNVEA